ncbi:MAG TPA: exodeoxyribonuclease V subunit gamma [Pseudothauera hydrothermalis]|nr:exodeoxyribonuclease V subunit gamma [Pseudothauera hydrothermalis]
MFAVAFSNRFETLLELLLARLAAERPGPFGRRELVVPNSAIRRRIELAVAEREGVAAQLQFDFLAQWLWQQIGRVVPDVGARSPYAPALLAWRIFGLLSEGGADHWVAAHPRLAAYLAAADARMRYELAERIARVFDHYLTYRPQWLAAWIDGRSALERCASTAEQRADEAWQAELWRRIQAAMPQRREHPAAAFLRALTAMDETELAALGLPRCVHVVALPALPPLYLDVLRELARVVDVQLYTLNPCQEYWFDVVDPRRLSWLATRQRDLFVDTGNRLLAAWGRQTQAHIDLLFEGEHPVEEEALFIAHPADHLLARVHNAILNLTELQPGSVVLNDADRSIEVHVCHSRTRELEVLHDRLLGLFAADPTLRPDDILVLTPELDTTAPLIEAVFGTAPAARRIPWRITGLAATRENPIAQVLDALLALVASRYPASRVFDLLQQPPVAARFGLDLEALETAHQWLHEAGFRWGLRAEDGLHTPAYTLEEGLHRLFLAWAAGEAASAAPFAGRIGAGWPEGSEGQLLGRLWRYAEVLRLLREQLLRPQQAADWQRSLNAALDHLVADDARWAEALHEVRAAIAGLVEDIGAAGLTAALPLDVVRPALAARLDDPARGGVPGGAVTFSAMAALRGLPYRVVAIVGLDRDVFPGNDRTAEFDLMAAFPAKGDRQRRVDDRNLFLDLLLAARDVLHLSYTGRSVRDGAELPPSVLVDELLDVLAEACASDPADPAALAAARRRLTVVHPLQPFSADYFLPDAARDRRLVSYHEDYATALAARLGALSAPARLALPAVDADEDDAPSDEHSAAEAPAAPFFTAPLPAPDAAWRTLTLTQLIRFYRNPSRYLLRERLGVDLPESKEPLADVEPFVPDWPARQALAARLLPVLMETELTAEALLALAQAGAEYPAGALGEDALRAELTALQTYTARLRAATPGACLPAHESRLVHTLEGESWELRTAFTDLRPGGRVYARFDDTRAGDYLAAWLAHLALCAQPPDGVECVTRGVSRDGDFVLLTVPAEEARTRLAELIAYYRAGLMRPLHFYPKSAWAYVEGGQNIGAAQRTWHGGRHTAFGEASDPAYRLALRGLAEPLDEEFYALAETVFAPMMTYLEDARRA